MYQPKISDDHIHNLYYLKTKQNKLMTRILDQILSDYFESYLRETDMLGKKVLCNAALRRLSKSD